VFFLTQQENKKASIRWQDSAPPISGCLSCIWFYAYLLIL